MNQISLAAACLVVSILASCNSSSKSRSGSLKAGAGNTTYGSSTETDAYYLYKLAKDSNTKRDFDSTSYSKTVAICCLIGLPERHPFNFIHEQGGVDFFASFVKDDPLGWSNDLDNGAYVTIEADLGLIVLEYPPHSKMGVRNIKDVIQYSVKDHPEIDTNFYNQLSATVIKSYEEAMVDYNELVSKTNQVSERRISD